MKMKELFEIVELIAKKVKKSEELRFKLADFLKRFDLTRRVRKDELKNVRIAAVDGGLVHRSLHGFDMILTRVCGVLYEYKDGKLLNVDYYPNPNPTPKPTIIFDSFSDMEFLWRASFERQKDEVELAIEVVKRWKPDLLLLDGSIVPSQFETMSKNSLIYEYKTLINDYLTLLKTREGRLIAGVVKDSRGIRFCDEIKRKLKIPQELLPVLQTTRDTNLLFYLLKTGERTRVFSYSSSPRTHPLLKDFGKFGKEIYGFYLRTAEFDRPIRVDFCSKKPERDANRISSILLALSGQHPGYGIPSILIEADQRARIRDAMIDVVYQSIVSNVGNLPSLFKLRGKDKPF